MKALWLPLFGSFLVALACNDEKTPEESYAGRYANAVCDVMGPCCRQNGFDFDHDNCVLGGAGFVQSGVDNARKVGAIFDASAADDCVAGASRLARACLRTADDPAVSAACGRVFYGVKPAGEACKQDLECAPGSSGRGKCYGASLDGSTTGTCVMLTGPAKVGETCGVTSGLPPAMLADCGSGQLQCDFGSRTCQPLAPIGAPCPGFTTCVGDGYCNAGTCAQKLASGMPCTKSDECATGACIRGTCGQNGIGSLTPCTGARE